MGDASNLQTDFRGGEWSQAAQGRMDDKEYHRALNVCLNAYPLEAGPWTRRQGTRRLGLTAGGRYAQLVPFHFAANAPYEMEFTDALLRFWQGAQLSLTNDVQGIVSVSTASPAVVTTATAHGWTTGDVGVFLFAGTDITSASPVMNRQVAITTTGATTFSIADPVTNVAIDGSTFTVPAGSSFGRVLALVSPYTQSQVDAVRYVQAESLSANLLRGSVILLHGAVAPRVVTNTVADTGNNFAQFSLTTATFTDGPYFDPVVGTVTPSAKTGSITLSGAPANTFTPVTDIGRFVRLFSEPAAWAVGTAYVVGNVVKYTDGNYYTSITAGTGRNPDSQPTFWSLTPSAAIWTWGTITAVASGTSATVTINGPDLLYTTAITTWRLGLYSGTTGYPTCGVFHEGRLFLGGAVGNRFDASCSNDIFNMAPTATDGTVGDANAISYIFNSDDVNPILWMLPEQTGVLAGTAGGEWLIQASQLSDPLTPTSCQAKRITKYKCANILPVRAAMGQLFVQAQGKRLLEYTIDAFSQKFMGRNVTEKAAHITASGIAQIAYQQDFTPIVWARMVDGTLAGMIYKRESSFSSEPPTFTGWHRHTLGSGVLVESLVSGPNATGTLETITLSVLDKTNNTRYVEMLTDGFLETDVIASAWFVDSAIPPVAILEDLTNNTVKLAGYIGYAGRTLSVWFAGLDCGDYLVAADGTITVPLAGASVTFPGLALLTDAFIKTWANQSTTGYDVKVARKTTVVNPNPGGICIQSYIDTSTVTGATDNADVVYDCPNNRLILMSVGSGATNGIQIFDASSGAYLGGITAPALFATAHDLWNNVASNSVQGPFCIDGHGYLYFCSDGFNQGVIRKVDISDPQNIKIIGGFARTGNAFISDITHVAHPGNMVGVSAGSNDYVVSTGSTANTGVTVIQTNRSISKNFIGDVGFNFFSTITENGCDLCAGLTSYNGRARIGHAYILGHRNADDASTANINLYHLQIVPGSTATLAVLGAGIAPSAIDAAWSHYSVVRGPVLDKTDGHVIIWVSTLDAVANQQYVVKLNSATGAIIWKTAVAAIPNVRTSLWNTNIQYGKVAWMVASTIYVCTTSSGAVATQAVTTTVGNFGQFSDDSNGTLFVDGTYTSGGGAPTPLNGTVTFASNKWYRLQTITGFGQATATCICCNYLLPVVAGYTYTSQGQRVRPAEAADAGARNGPALGKTRRNHDAAFQLAQTQGISIGTQLVDLTKLRTLLLKADRVNTNAANVLFTGVTQQDVDDDNTFDGMLAWQITRPYPAIVTAIAGFLHCQDL